MIVLETPGRGIRRQARADPSGLAVVDAAGRTWSWAWLDGRADTLAAGLGARGAGLGRVVAARVEATADGLALLVGAERAGSCLVPLPGHLTEGERAAALAEIEPALVVGEEPGGISVGNLGGGDEARGSGDRLGTGRSARPAEVQGVASGAAVGAAVDGAIGVMTSGTTGRPKVAMLSPAALLASAEAWTAALPAASGWLLALGLAHVAGLGVAWRAFGAGLPVVIAPPGDAAAILAALHHPPFPSHLSLVPTQLVRLLDAARDLPPPATVRAVPLGGSAAPAGLVRRALSAGWPVVPTYGLSEAGSGATALATAEAAGNPASAGRPLPGVELRIADAGLDRVGEIELRTPSAFSGYLRRPELTAAAFTSDGWLRTGDLGRLDHDGRLEVADRRDDLIVSGGENVRPAEVEAVLEDHPAIAEAGVVGRLDETWGAAVVAVLVLRAGQPDPGDDALRSHCRDRLAPWKVPAAFVRWGVLPRTVSGKLLRAELRRVVATTPAPASTGAGRSGR